MTQTDSNSTGNLVLVNGAARSGTTMLDLMLGNSESCFSCGEIHAFFRPHRTHHFDPDCSCGEKPCPVWESLGKVPEQDLHANILQMPGIEHVIDSSKDLNWVLDSNRWAAGHGIPVVNLLLWKDPKDLAYSHWKRGRPIDYYRRAFLHYYERFLNLNLPFIAINYQDLVGNPSVILKDICDRCGIDWHEGQEEFWNKKHHHFFGSAGTGKQVSEGGSKIGSIKDFPQEFLDAWNATDMAQGTDTRLNRCIEGLQAADINSGTAASGNPTGPAIKPLWYYRHALKSLYRKRFPVELSASEST